MLDFTADFVMSQTWKCLDNPVMDGVYITYYDDLFEKETDCIILQPNSNFQYPDVYQEICKRICEEHNKHLQSSIEQEETK